jgi:hypothetical protein
MDLGDRLISRGHAGKHRQRILVVGGEAVVPLGEPDFGVDVGTGVRPGLLLFALAAGGIYRRDQSQFPFKQLVDVRQT